MNKKVVFITTSNFTGRIDSGGKQASNRNYELIRRIWGRENVKYIIVTQMHSVKETQNGIILCTEQNIVRKYLNYIFLRHGYSRRTEMRIHRYISDFDPDIIFIDDTVLGRIARFSNKHVIAFYHNIEKRYARMIIMNHPIRRLPYYWSVCMNERYVSRKSVFRICLNNRDAIGLRKEYSVNSNFILPITMNDSMPILFNNQYETGTLLFVGSYFYPNIQGIIWFCKEVMPYIKKKLIIAGNGMEKIRNMINDDNIEVYGYIENLSELYQRSDAVVLPILSGEGMKVKTAEAMMYGKPIFATDEALEGYDIGNVTDICRCNSAREFIDAIRNQKVFGFSPLNRELFISRYETTKINERLLNKLKEAGLA